MINKILIQLIFCFCYFFNNILVVHFGIFHFCRRNFSCPFSPKNYISVKKNRKIFFSENGLNLHFYDFRYFTSITSELTQSMDWLTSITFFFSENENNLSEQKYYSPPRQNKFFSIYNDQSPVKNCSKRKISFYSLVYNKQCRSHAFYRFTFI